jgi:hypothetical protein
MNAQGAKGLFVEAAPYARAVFEVERACTVPAAKPRWWAIHLGDDARPAEERLRELGIAAIVAKDENACTFGVPRELGLGWRLWTVPGKPRRVAATPIPPGPAGWAGLLLGACGFAAIGAGALRSRTRR